MHNPENRHPLVGVIARQIHLKGIQYIIPAFARLREHYPDALLLLVNAHGPYAQTLQKLLDDLLPPSAYKQVRFEEDITALYHLFDVHVHTPIDEVVEAFGQTYVESLAAGVPGVFSISGVAHEFIRNGENAIVVPHRNSDAIHEALEFIINPANRTEIQRLNENGRRAVAQKFALNDFLRRLSACYR